MMARHRVFLTLAVALLGSFDAPAQAQQVTITIGGYGGAPANAAPPPYATQQPAGNGGTSALQGQAAWAQAAAYGRYMQYLAVLNYQATHGGALPPGPDAKDYFTNGATVTTVPSAGPGAAYFNNGSEATVLPPTPAPTAAAPVTPSPAPQASSSASPWVVVYQNPSPAPPPPVSAASSPPPPPAEPVAEAHAPPIAMSFEDWLRSMGIDPQEASAEPQPSLTSAEVPVTAMAEPSAEANEVRARASYDRPEKPRVRVAASSGSGWGLTGAFAAGLVLGGVAVLRLRDRARQAGDRATTPAP
jgi:hypothetical protein